MIRTICQCTIETTKELQSVDIPKGAKLIHVGSYGRVIGLWFEFNVKESLTVTARSFRVYRTDKQIGGIIECGKHVGTVLDTPFVWHVYEVT